MFYLYEHWRTDTNVPFYVGKGNDKRISYIWRENNHHTNICALLGRTGHKVVQKIVFATEIEQEALDAEIANIAAYRDAGIELCNGTDGGEGVSGYIATDELRAARSKRMLGPENPAHRDDVKIKKSLARRGKPLLKLRGDNNPSKNIVVRTKQSNSAKGRSRLDMRGLLNPMNNPDIIKNFLGSNNPSAKRTPEQKKAGTIRSWESRRANKHPYWGA